MALTGLHVIAGFAGARGFKNSVQSLFSEPQWSHTFTDAGTTAESAPAAKDNSGQPVFRIISAVDVYVSVGPIPDAAASPRYFIPALELTDVFVQGGDRLAWVAA